LSAVPEIPSRVLTLAQAVRDAGGRAWLVGGWVRDLLLGQPSKDFDVEVHGLEAPALKAILKRRGSINEVGRSFGVFKLRIGDQDLDVSIPRKDSKVGPGHKGIHAQGDPHLGIEQALLRRDLTINAIAYDPLDGTFADPYGGRRDLAAKVLRAVDRATFGEDPLRALRVLQFAARLEFSVDPELALLVRTIPLDALPPERIWLELEKLLLKARRPSVGLALGRTLGVLPRVLPELAIADDAVDRAAEIWRPSIEPWGRKVALVLGALLGDLEPESVAHVLDRLRIHTIDGFRTRDRVLECVAEWKALAHGWDDTALRQLAERAEVGLVAAVADSREPAGRGRAAFDRATELGVLWTPLAPLLHGRDLRPLGVEQGKRMGDLLAAVRARQLRGEITTRDEAIEAVRPLLETIP
jgi:tRNA nucleotidyltransferase (CCA-adding enzyme)